MPSNNGKIVLPKPTPEKIDDDDVENRKNAGGDAEDAFEDIEIVIDEDEVEAEKGSNPSGRKY
jgi:hypothetical protein